MSITFKIVSHDRQLFPGDVRQDVVPEFDEFQEMMINGGRPIEQPIKGG